MTTWQRLQRVEEQEANRAGCNPGGALDDAGLLLHRHLANFDYDLTPINTATFANTGGDGVHFGFLCLDNQVPGAGPVVMTVPCAYGLDANVIVGQDLREFLCLGCRFGYFELEQLVYDPEETLPRLQDPQPEDGEEEKERLLALLRTELALQPWPDVAGRLAELQREYLPMLQMKPID